jgi:hypothetical protein
MGQDPFNSRVMSDAGSLNTDPIWLAHSAKVPDCEGSWYSGCVRHADWLRRRVAVHGSLLPRAPDLPVWIGGKPGYPVPYPVGSGPGVGKNPSQK